MALAVLLLFLFGLEEGSDVLGHLFGAHRKIIEAVKPESGRTGRHGGHGSVGKARSFLFLAPDPESNSQ